MMKIWVVTWYDGAAEFEIKGAYRSRAAAVGLPPSRST